MSLKIGLKAARFSTSMVFGEGFFSEKWGVVIECGLAPYRAGKPRSRQTELTKPQLAQRSDLNVMYSTP
ncbi:hypothetical protein [Klebsiella sp. SWET4]|uniref:hypothetical protein n=1 Tax=Klebsiella sp. SWET4 TaxID=2961620 RepID=UPI0020C8CB45|nr:hypothetical protein [Klebsiella sp. SWET4]HDS9666746.1 hypothetical protein [Klebsiella variicola]HDU5034910.1 hypothetical protein [Klebsiella variicola]